MQANVYPYRAGQNNLSSIIPPKARDEVNAAMRRMDAGRKIAEPNQHRARRPAAARLDNLCRRHRTAEQRVLEPHRAFILERIKQTPHLTLHGLKDELAARGVRVSHNTVWLFLRREGLRFKKNAVRP